MTEFTHYEQNAKELVTQYESLSFEEVHAGLIDLLPAPGATILDVGAGSGRDAAWLSRHGYDVVAVEPSDAMRTQARALHGSQNIHWLSDSLPDLSQVRRLGLTFDLILLSAVWMHVPPAARARALRKLATMLAPSGRIAISLRLGEPDTARAMHQVTLHELSAHAQQFGLRLLRATDSADRLGRPGIAWTSAVFGLPDDGLGALPLLRHLVLIDEKSSTYKIALLRIVARMADAAGGAARHEADYVAVPMGLAALFWMRMYKPLIESGLPQMPASRAGTKPGFVTDSFNALRMIHACRITRGRGVRGRYGQTPAPQPVGDCPHHSPDAGKVFVLARRQRINLRYSCAAPDGGAVDAGDRRAIPVELRRVARTAPDLASAHPLQRLGRAGAGIGMGTADRGVCGQAPARYSPAYACPAGLGRSGTRHAYCARRRRAHAGSRKTRVLRLVRPAPAQRL
ncbi:methyltransferase domain-containing protein [Massilia sp. CCM 8733]|uniref:Methyltransferase domain-containing protein n=1 Tax=Massilia mucilaginosa TaxID=2609282 RepID=A0ABX0P1Q7_9BURK|nr:class I SAM-dependent methyltransferase [Massilia mucilaginosa]NHZ92968.1 methyltransferase domain-containing protein [Massilia mucilaginosa]